MERSRDFIETWNTPASPWKRGFTSGPPSSAQQAAEKALKAVFQHLGAVAWGPSVLGLLEELAKQHPVSESLLDGASELDKAYIPTRHPDALPEGAPFERYRRPEAERLLSHAEEIYAFCKGLLPPLDPGGDSGAPQGGA
ncbi:HEPN domain-containing protein [Thermus caldifontis]|uniref:HEPN domain-containing protein n=1 Tax=Thermus caldifontis TaxID=1930763 RepID=UPI001F074AA2|nr:HEPN domain-containing protein [Thermus caldifontis]